MAVTITTDDLASPGQRLRAVVVDGLPFGVPVGIAPLVGGVLTALIPLPLIWTDNRQGLHDTFADTLVLRDGSAPWA